MVRAPCCAKVGLKKGPWTTEEDKILISYIENNGHDNWRALPKKAGLLRCGKSCRLRWTNYLRPDIKRGNFTKEEEETIFELHETLGNKWSAIAARLPGRTDNEIKNVWHTHLKKRLGQKPATSEPVPQPTNSSASSPRQSESLSLGVIPSQQGSESQTYTTMSPQPSSSDFSSFTDASVSTHNMSHLQIEDMDLWETFPVIDGSLWSEPPLSENTSMPPELLAATDDSQAQSQFNSIEEENMGYTNQSTFDDDMDFWYNLFVKAGGSTELSEF